MQYMRNITRDPIFPNKKLVGVLAKYSFATDSAFMKKVLKLPILHKYTNKTVKIEFNPRNNLLPIYLLQYNLNN